MSDSGAIDRLEAGIKRLTVEWDRFFAGGLELPPEEMGRQIRAQVRRLRDQQLSPADRFRLSTLESRLNVYSERAARRLRALEEGREAQRRAGFLAGGSRTRPDAGVVIGETVDSEAAESLYKSLVEQSPRTPKFDQQSFATYLEQQASAIRRKTGCSQVQFRVAVEGGQAKLKAKPVEANPATDAAPSQKGQPR